MTTPIVRALVGARVSVMKDGKVSPQAQIETATNWATARGYAIVGQFEDLGVSASVRPDDRPDLGPWITDPARMAQWDCIVWSKLDRAFRSIRHCVDFAHWAEDQHKMVVFAEDGLTLDYRPDRDTASIEAILTQVFLTIASAFAEIELNRFRSRASDGQRVIRQTTRWAGGTVPLGYRAGPHKDHTDECLRGYVGPLTCQCPESGKGRGLERDPEGYALLHHMATMLLDGQSFNAIASELGPPWTGTNVQLALTHPRTQGYKTHHKQTVLDGDNREIRLAAPTFDHDTWKQIQEAVTARRLHRRQPSGTQNPMLGIGVCGSCGASLTLQTKRNTMVDGEVREYRYYKCSRAPRACRGVAIRAESGDSYLEETFLQEYGDDRVTRRVFQPAEDHAADLEEVRGIIARLRRESDAGLIVSPEDEQNYLDRMATLIRRRTELEAKPSRAAGWVVETTDQTYREVWAADDSPGISQSRRKALVDKGVRFVLHPSPGGNAVVCELLVPDVRYGPFEPIPGWTAEDYAANEPLQIPLDS